MTINLPITGGVWRTLVEANRFAVRAKLAEPGVFAPGIGPEYRPGESGSILYVGKSPGPRGAEVGSGYDQAASVLASTDWMTGFKHRSAFWQMADKIDPTRRRMAWTNVCKMDQIGRKKPSTGALWRQIRDASIAALADEIDSLSPAVILLVTSNYCGTEVGELCDRLGYRQRPLAFKDGWTTLFLRANGKYLVKTKYPERWRTTDVDSVVDLVCALMGHRAISA